MSDANSYVTQKIVDKAALGFLNNEPIRIFCHTGAPGNDGTGSRLASGYLDVPAESWEVRTGINKIGLIRNRIELNFGILDADNDVTLTHLSYWKVDGTFLGWVKLLHNTVISAGDSLRVAVRTLRISFTRGA